MNCKEFEKQIPKFINRELDYFSLKQFCKHLEHCEECKEELTINVLLTEGMQRLEDGRAFDLNAEMRERLKEAKDRLVGKEKKASVGLALELLAICIFAGVVIVLLV